MWVNKIQAISLDNRHTWSATVLYNSISQAKISQKLLEWRLF